MPTDLPAALVAADGGLSSLRVCARHGEPAVEHRRTVFRSPVPRWTYALILLGVIVFLIVAFFVPRRVKAPAWPFCPRCRQLRVIRLLTGIGLMLVSALALVLAASLLPAESSYGNLVGLPFVLVFIVGIGVTSMASSGSIAAGTVSGDGASVHIRHPHPRFAEEAAAVQHAAAGRWAAQHGYVHQGQPAQGQPVPPPQGRPAAVAGGGPAPDQGQWAPPRQEQPQQWDAPLGRPQDPWAGRAQEPYGPDGAAPA